MITTYRSTETKFSQFAAFEALKKRARQPFNLTEPGHLNSERMERMRSSACGLTLLYAMERVDDVTLGELAALAREADVLGKMRAMQKGEEVNFVEGCQSERRAALHTATRDFFTDAPRTEAADLAKQEWEKLQSFLKTQDEMTDLIVIGIGGSDLGPRAVYLALKAYSHPQKRVHFISNVDPDDASSVLEGLDLSKTLVAVISKSGTTLETLSNEAIVKQRFSRAGLDPAKHFVAVTEKASPLDQPDRYLACFYLWEYIGGRFSTTSMVGALPLAFSLGPDLVQEFLRGACCMDQTVLEEDLRKNPPLMAALLGVWNQNFLGYPTCAVIPYSHALRRFAAHVQQCTMESNGKGVDKQGNTVPFLTGPIVWGEPGTNAQHSFFQLLHQGKQIVPLEFIAFKESQYKQDTLVNKSSSQEKLLSNLFAQSLALALGKHEQDPNRNFLGNRPSQILLGKQLDAFSMGALLSYYEHKVVFQGFIWDINSFDQEGVQLGKTLAKKFLTAYEKKRQGESDLDLDDLQASLMRQMDEV